MKTASALVIIFFALSALAAQECLECHRTADGLPPEHEKVDFVPASCPECHTEPEQAKLILFAQQFILNMLVVLSAEFAIYTQGKNRLRLSVRKTAKVPMRRSL
jgi:hypothetical protein